MPSFIFCGPYPTAYTGGRDANGRNLGLVEPGDIRLFDDSPPDRYWTPELPPREDGDEGGDPGGSERAAGEPDGTAQDENPETSTPGE